jgi:hypothetical protein
MNDIVFLTYHKGIQGSYLNHLDLQQYLKSKGHKVKFYCENVKKLFEIIEGTRRNYKFEKGEIKILKKEKVIMIDPKTVIITDFKSLIMINNLDYSIICKKLLVMDSIELTYHLKDMDYARFYYDVDINNLIRPFFTDEIIFLMPQNNYDIFTKRYPKLKAQVFYKHINVDMLNSLKCDNQDGYFFRWDDSDDYVDIVMDKFGKDGFNFEPEWKERDGHKIPLKYNEITHIFDYKALVYRRRKYLEYQEQFGRLIFEYILLGKEVYFVNEPFTDDGLTDYLRHFNIKFDGNKIITSKEELTDRMKNYDFTPWN